MIATLEEWNAFISGCPDCCPWPLSDAPTAHCRSKSSSSLPVGFTFPSYQGFYGITEGGSFNPSTDIVCPDTAKVYRTVTLVRTSTNEAEIPGGSFSVVVDPDADYNGIGYPSPSVETGDDFPAYVDTAGASGVFTGTQEFLIYEGTPDEETVTVSDTLTFSDPITPAMLAETSAAKTAAADWTAEACAAFRTLTLKTCDSVEVDWPDHAAEEVSQTRFQIPFSHTGTAFQIDGDTLFTPANGDPPVLTALPTLNWTGPGDALDEDDATWFTGYWPEVSAPTGDYGELELVNVRYTHMPNNPAGVKPQIHPGFGTYVEP